MGEREEGVGGWGWEGLKACGVGSFIWDLREGHEGMQSQ